MQHYLNLSSWATSVLPFQSMGVIEWVLLTFAVVAGLVISGIWRARQRDLAPMPDWADPDVFSIVWNVAALAVVLSAAIPLFWVRALLLGLVLVTEATGVVAYVVWRCRASDAAGFR